MQLTHSLSVSKDMPLVCVEKRRPPDLKSQVGGGGGVVWTEAEVDESQIRSLGEAKQISWGPVDRPLASQRLCACKTLGVVVVARPLSRGSSCESSTLARQTPDYSAERQRVPEWRTNRGQHVRLRALPAFAALHLVLVVSSATIFGPNAALLSDS